MEVQFLHTGEPVVVLSEGNGEPGEFVTDGTGRKVWQTNGDYQPARVVRLGAIEDVEQGQIAATWEDTATAQRDAAIEAGEHPDRVDAQFVPPAAEPPLAGQIGAGGTDGATAATAAPGATGAAGETTDELTPLSDDERAELVQLRAQVAGGDAATDNADVAGRNTAEDTATT